MEILKNNINWVINLFRVFLFQKKHFGFFHAFARFFCAVCRKLSLNNKYAIWYVNDKEHFVIENWIISRGYKNMIKKSLESYDDANLSQCKNNINKIWVCWLQGEDQMPPIVKCCYNQLIKMSGSFDVVLITLDNVGKYIDINQKVFENYKKKYFKPSHFADLIRLKLLSKYGGLWIDSTVFVTKPISNFVFAKPFFSIKTNPVHNFSVSVFRWCGFILGADQPNKFFNALSNTFELYLCQEKAIVHYLLIDYLIDILYKCDKSFSTIVDNNMESNPYLHKFFDLMNAPFDKKKYEEIIRDTNFFKLSYYLDELKERTSTGELTYYGFIHNG